MNIREYQEWTNTTAQFSPLVAQEYLALGLVSEAGEVAGKIKKLIRGDDLPEDYYIKILDEVGDVLWYVAQLAELYGTNIESLAQLNHDKLTARLHNNTIKGSGDNR